MFDMVKLNSKRHTICGDSQVVIIFDNPADDGEGFSLEFKVDEIPTLIRKLDNIYKTQRKLKDDKA